MDETQRKLRTPYDILGVKVGTGCAGVKKAFHKLALRAHEDKGGSKDEMIALNDAYKSVLHETTYAETSSHRTPRQVKHEIQNAEQWVPKRTDLLHNWNVNAFNREFEEKIVGEVEFMPAAMRGGYGDLMDPSGSDNAEIPVKHAFETRVIQHVAPRETTLGFYSAYDLEQEGQVDDYTLTAGGLHMADYREAMAPPPPPPGEEDNSPPNIDTRVTQRESEQSNFAAVQRAGPSPYTWSYDKGLVDKDRQPVCKKALSWW